METKVRVGVRVRPLLPNEMAVGSEMVMKYPGTNSKQIGMGERAFTYDHVFRPEVEQNALYGMTAKPMLKPFLDGYNVTIIAYGQTGSGKTYTMGSEAVMEGNGAVGSGEASPVGLIPRFVDDLFTHLAERQHHPPPQQAGNTVVSASFLEIYGEDVYDLLDDSADGRGRPSLPIREDVNAGVMVSGLKQVAVSTRAEALQVLRKGTMNRTTAATLMNVVSSRSHAVFTVTLQQTLSTGSSSSSSSGGGGGGGEDEASVEGEAEGQVVVSKLTFVDLAGSERLKRTGAEGERRREGIQINVGLLALGSVINALADEERLVKGKKSVHVPYRQSKLTRLLQDALGGNSQTLFLACVSPADINASETLSTLYYANRARNIRNKPIKNTDSVKEELRCLRQTAHFLKAEMVRQKFLQQPPPPPLLAEGEEADAVSVASSVASVPQIPDSELMERADVKAFLEALGAKLDNHLRRVGIEGVDGSTLLLKPFAPATPGGNRHSPAPWGDASHSHRVSYFSPTAVAAASRNALPPTSPPRGSITQGMGTRLDFEAAAAAAAAAVAAAAAAAAAGGMEGGNGAAPLLSLPAAAAGAVVSEEMVVEVEGDPEKELALLEKLRELQQHEAAMGAEEEQGREALATVEGELEQKEGLLEQLRQTLEGYHGMRSRYERLLKDVEALEMEKEALHYQLEQVLVAEQQQQQQQQQQQHQRHKSGGGGAAAVPAGSASTAAAAAAAATALREKLKGVEAQLDRLKVQKKQQENLQRLAERQKQELLALEENLGKLKNVRAGLMKKQKETSIKHEALIQQKRREMEALRKADRALQKKMGRLQLENRGAKVLLDRKESCIRTLKQKAAKAETHVLRLLQLQNRNREAVQQRRTTAARRGAGLGVAAAKKAGGPSSSSSSGEVVVNEEKVGAARFLIEKLVEERLGDLETRRLLEQKTRDYGQLVQELRTQAQALESLKAGGEGEGEEGEEEEEEEEVDEAIREAEARLEGLDVEMELCAAAIAELQARLESYDANSNSNRSSNRNDSPSKHGRKPSSSSSSSSSSTANLGLNEEAALKAVSELGSAEAKVLLAGLMEGMVEARAKVWELESDVQKKACAEEGLRIDRTRLERRLSESARGFEQKVVDLKCQHQQDLMTLVRSGVGNSGATLTAMGKTTTRVMTRAAAKGLLAQAVDDGKSSEEKDEMELVEENEREREREREEVEEEEEEEDREDQVAKRQFEALVAQNDSLEARCQTLAGALDQATAAKERLEREAEAAHREARELREALEALRAAEDKTEEQRGEGGVMEELLEAWAELGISEERRKSLLDKVTQAPSNVCQNLLEEARRQRAQVKSEVMELKEELAVLARLVDGRAIDEEEEGEEGVEGGTHQQHTTEEALVMLRDDLRVRHVQATSVLQGRLQQARRLVREAEKLQRSVGGEPRPALVDLLRLGALLVASAEEGGEDAMEEEGEREGGRQESLDMIKVLEAAAEAGRGVGRAVLSLSEEKLQEWEGEIKAMRRARSAMVLELQGLLERGHGACSLMDMSAQSLKDTIQATLERGQQALPPPQSPQPQQQQPYAPSPFSSPAGGGTPRLITLTSPSPRPSHRRSSITPPPASVISWDSPSLHKMIAILTSGGGGATVAGLWAAEDQAVSLADAIPQARFLVDVLVECWNRRRELLVLCWSTAEAVKNCVVGEGLERLAEGVCLTLPEADGEEGEVQNGGLSAEEAEAFVAGLDALLEGVEEEGRATRATLEGLWDVLRAPLKERSTALSLRPAGAAAGAAAAAAAAGEQQQQQQQQQNADGAGRGMDVAVAFRRLQADLERTQVNTRGRLEVEAWIGQVLERILQQVQSLQAGLETLEAQQELVHVLGERRRRQEGILKLNDEIVGLEGRARRFETEASDRTRLVDRKTNSARLLKEEKFRKDSKNRFARLLEKLRQELEEWEALEGVAFDQSLLGEDIQRALSHSLESGGRSWVEGRTELMHLHTSQPKSRNSSPNSLSPPLLVEEEVVAAAVPPPQAPPPTKRDPFARVLSPSAATAEVITPEGPSAVAAAITAAAAPRDGRGMGGGLLGLNRLTGAGASVSDLLVRGKHIQHSTAPHAVDGLHSKKHRKGGGGGSGNSSSSSSSSHSSDTGGPGVSSACCRRGARGEQENIAKN